MSHRGTTFAVILKNRDRPLRLLHHSTDTRKHRVYVAPLFVAATASVHLAAGARTKSISPRFRIDRPKFSFFSTVVHVLAGTECEDFQVNEFQLILGWMTNCGTRDPWVLDETLVKYLEFNFPQYFWWFKFQSAPNYYFSVLCHKQSHTLNNYSKQLSSFCIFSSTYQWLFLMNSVRIFKQWWMIYQVR